MEARFLSPGMSKLSVKDYHVARCSAALATPSSRSYLGHNFAGAPSTAQIQIRWKHILIDSVQMLGGTEPMYVREESMDRMFQARVSFRLPIDMSGTDFKEISVAGIKCPTLFEAENEASVVALQELQDGCLKMHIMDVSRTRCIELEKWCHEILDKSTDIYYAAKSLLAHWEGDMDKVGRCYSSVRRKALEGTWSEMPIAYDLIPAVANELATLTRQYYQRLMDLSVNVDKMKNLIDITLERVKYYFCERTLNQVNKNRGSLPQEVNIRMKFVLQEMMVSIGWKLPEFNVVSLGMSLYVCETFLFPNHIHVGPPPTTLTITGSEMESEEEAVESSCIAAISYLEREKSLCLVDVNLNHRSHAELYVVETRDVMESVSHMIPKVLSEWEAMVDEIQACKQRCQELPVDQLSGEANHLQRMKCSSTKTVADLHEVCAADVRFAKDRIRNAGVWIGE